MQRRDATKLAKLLKKEVLRAQERMRVKGHPRPYFVSQLLRSEELWITDAKYGALTADSHYKRRDSLADVRVGSYRYDQVQDGGLNDNSKQEESFEMAEMPIGGDEAGVQHALWRLTEARYREALDAYLRKKSFALTFQDENAALQSFQRTDGKESIAWRNLPEVDHDHYRNFVRKASAELRRYPQLKNGSVKFTARHSVRIFVSSEGTLQVQSMPYYTLEVYLWYLSEKGVGSPLSKTFFVADPDELPTLAQVRKLIRGMHSQLQALTAAPTVRAFSGPVLLDPRPAGLLFHEALGHRLEGNRLLSPTEGHTFRDSRGQAILPEGLTLRDDPRLERFEGKSLTGHYAFDDEGVDAQNAELIVDGELRGFLTSRAPIGKGHKSNGHGRSRHHARAMSRMGVTIVDVEEGLSEAKLRDAFVAEIREQGVPYGIRIVQASGGETSTEAYDFQAFLGEIDIATRIFPDGREELIRGVDLVGTPLNAIRGIVAVGKDRAVDNSFCGAESGDLPVSTISPALLVDELELQNKHERSYTQFAYPMPWEK
ncbi:MAG: metallopeptidase TldD-related protein [Myxococcota bacterium]